MWVSRAKYTTRSVVAKFTTGALIAICGAVCAKMLRAKSWGRSTPMRCVWFCAAASTAPFSPTMAMSRTSRLRPVISSSRRFAWSASSAESAVTAGRNSDSVPANSTSTPSSIRLSPASAALKKRVARPSLSAMASCSPREMRFAAAVSTASAKRITTPQMAAWARCGKAMFDEFKTWTAQRSTSRGPWSRRPARWFGSRSRRTARRSGAPIATTRCWRRSPVGARRPSGRA